MGRVYKALHTVMGRVVALKLMNPELSEDEPARQRFLREVRTVTRLSHPNIVLAYDANEADGVLFLAMEYVEGTNLADQVRSRGPLPVGQACALMRQAALGLQHAHEQGLVHRDIKPHNLLVPRPRRADSPAPLPGGEGSMEAPVLVKIADFGLARILGPPGGDTLSRHPSGSLLGTPDFVSPEQCRDSRLADIRSDLYSLGCTFHFLLTGSVPFPAEGALEKVVAHMMDRPPAVEDLVGGMPAGVSAIVSRLLEKAPDKRFQTPTELAQALEPFSRSGVTRALAAESGRTDEAAENRRSGAEATRVIEAGQSVTPPFPGQQEEPPLTPGPSGEGGPSSGRGSGGSR
jgi:serine/threonine-protein kinase